MKTEGNSGSTSGRPPHKDERLKEIVFKAAKLFFKNGYAKTSTREIAEAVGISKGLLYYYISSKEDFLDLFIDELTESFGKYNIEIIDQLPSTAPAMSLKRAVKEMISGMNDLQDMLLFWHHESGYMSPDQLKKIVDQELRAVNFFETIIKAGCETGEFSVDDAHLAAYQVHALCINWVLKRWEHRKRYSLEFYIKQIQKSALAIAGYRIL